MYEFSSKNSTQDLEFEEKIITKCIFKGLTIAQIAKHLSCSQSTVSYKMSKLFAKYNAKTRFEFVLGVIGEMVRNNKVTLEGERRKIKRLNSQVNELTTILRNIILNKNNKKEFEYWVKEAKELIL